MPNPRSRHYQEYTTSPFQRIREAEASRRPTKESSASSGSRKLTTTKGMRRAAAVVFRIPSIRLQRRPHRPSTRTRKRRRDDIDAPFPCKRPGATVAASLSPTTLERRPMQSRYRAYTKTGGLTGGGEHDSSCTSILYY